MVKRGRGRPAKVLTPEEQAVRSAIKENKLIVIDEIQRVPSLLDIVHSKIQSSSAIFALTGSSARKLKRGNANLLAGRASVYKLFPLTFTELKNDFQLETALTWGTLPELCTIQDESEKIRFLQSYTDTYIQEEIVAEQIIRKLPPFRRFLDSAAQMNGKIINYSKIASEISTDVSNVKNYYEILEDTLLGFKLSSYHRSIRKRQLQSPKFYWFDTGVVRSLAKQLGPEVQKSTSYYGELFESFIINQVKTGLEYQVGQFSLSYLRTKDDAEIDLIIERPGFKTICLEIKSGNHVRREEFTNLKKLSEDIVNSECYCLYDGKEKLDYNGVVVLPWREGLIDLKLMTK
jgi:predicted AAA+ superfamily ATPase